MPDVVPVKIRAIKRTSAQPVYDIQVKKNHNFFANGLLAHNCIIFQEQVMELAEKVAGFPKDKCDEVRRAIMKRSISGGEAAKKAAQETRDGFVKGCIANGYTEKVANNLYDKILYFAGYGFNKSLYFLQSLNIYKPDGKVEVKTIEDVQPGDLVMSRDEKTGQNVLITVLTKHDHGVLDLVEVELTTGEKVRCTWDHKFRTVETGEMLPLWMISERGLSIVVDSAASVSMVQSGLTSTKHGVTAPEKKDKARSLAKKARIGSGALSALSEESRSENT